MDELGRAGRAVAVAQHEVGQRRRIAASQSLVHIVGHGVQIQVPHGPEARHAVVDGLRQRRVIGAPVALDTVLHFGHGALALIQGSGHAGLADALPDQAQSLLCLDAGRQRRRPLALDLRRVQVGLVAIGIDIGTRKSRFQQCGAELGPAVPERGHMRVLAATQQTHGHDGAEVLGVGRAAVRRVADYGQNLAPGRVHQHRLGRSGLQKIRQRH